ncbi:MAG: TldD/PmbA family protein [Actinobacteria bacterium]|nr:TldD/PmbA family protein [Actinomycetota bacterium]
MSGGELGGLLADAIDAATGDGAAYADARSVESQRQSLSVNGPTVETLDYGDSTGLGVRVLVAGAWGYAATSKLSRDDAVRAARTAVEIAHASATVTSAPVELVPEPAHQSEWSTPVKKDPLAVPLEDKLALLTDATREMGRRNEIRSARATMDVVKQQTSFLSSEGASIRQTIVHTGAGIEATAVADGEVQQRSYPGSFRGHLGAGGYELIEAMDLAGNAAQTADEAAALLVAPECPSRVTTVVLDGHQVMLQVHESVGHPTELDRVLGMEAAFAGTSFVGIEDLDRFHYGSEAVNITSDPTSPGGLGSYGFDDEGVEGRRADLIREGVLVGFQTSRETAAKVGAARSNGTMRAEGWENFPLIRMPNINLLPGEGSLDDLLADVDDGIFMATNKSWSIDDKRKNFQFGCEIAWEIKNGRLGRMLKDPRYTGITPVFWGSCDAVAGPEEWRMWGTPNCGKGQPGQTMRVGHGTSPARFRNVSTGVST